MSLFSRELKGPLLLILLLCYSDFFFTLQWNEKNSSLGFSAGKMGGNLNLFKKTFTWMLEK